MAYAPAPAAGWPGPAYGGSSSSYAGGSYAAYGASTGYAGYYGGYDPSAAAYYQQQPGQGYAAGAVAPPLPPHAQGSAAGPSAPPAPPSSPPPPPPPGGEAAPGTAEDNSSASDKSTTTGAAAPPAPPSSLAAQQPAAGSNAAQPGQPPPGYDPVAYQQYYASYQAGVAAAGYNPASGYNASGYNASGYPGYPPYNQYPQQPYPGMQQQQPYPGVQQPYAGYGAPGGVRPDSSCTPTPTGQAGQQAHASRQERQGNAAAASAGGSYNAVPPPASVGVTGSNRIPISIRPQMGKSFAAAAAAGTAHSNATPAYVRVGGNNTSSLTAQRSQSLSSPSPTGASAGATAAPKPAAAKPAAAAGAGSGKFPPTFSAWVERCFERCRADTERAAMTAALTKRITAVEKAGRMWLVDWDKEPYPTLTDPAPSPSSGADRHGYGAATGLRAKRSRWEESADAAPAAAPAGRNGKQQQQLQQPLSKKQRKALARQQAQASEPALSYAEQLKLRQRAGRFGDGSAHAGGRRRRYDDYDDDVDMDAASDDPDVAFDASSVVIVGTSTQLEKSYFRLTGPPNPAEVRPAPVLRQALDRLVGLLRKGAVNWFYTCDQFKGLRQDCTVQHLRNELAVAVYEAHARAALEYGDLAEFNQCQTQLASMYADGVPGCVGEFTAYKLLYHTVHASSSAKPALLHTLRAALAYQQQAAGRAAGSTGSTQLGDAAVANALRARTAFFADNVSEFFKAYAAAPALGRALLDALAPHVRWAALNSVVKAYKTSVPVSFLAHMLGFVACSGAADAAPAPGAGAGADGTPLPGCRQAVCVGKAAGEATEEAGVAACVRWLQAHGAVLEAEDSSSPLLDVKSSLGKLVIPEPPKVAHGDENLSLGDFLARASGLQA